MYVCMRVFFLQLRFKAVVAGLSDGILLWALPK